MKAKLIIALALVAIAVPMCISGVQPELAEMTKQTDLEITAYDGFGVVSGTWKGLLPAGYSKVDLAIAEQLDPSSLVFEADGVTLVEQDLSYDLVDKYSLYEKYLGKEIIAKISSGDSSSVVAGTLLGYRGDSLVIEDSDGKIHMVTANAVELPALPEGLTSRPTVSWLLKSLGGTKEISMSYLTNGISWGANYNAILGEDEKTLDLSSSVSVTNNAGVDFDDAKLTLVAGDVNRVSRNHVTPVMMESAVSGKMAFDEDGGFSESTSTEYHKYDLERRVTLKDSTTKQIPFFSEKFDVEKEYVFDSSEPVYRYDTGAQGVAVKLKFDSKDAMPAGNVKVYKRSGKGLMLLGEDSIDHTAKDEPLRLTMGSSFDITAEKTQVSYNSLGTCSYEASYKVELKNHKDENVVVTVVENVLGDVEVTTSSRAVDEDLARKKTWQVPVSANGETTLTYTLRRTC